MTHRFILLVPVAIFAFVGYTQNYPHELVNLVLASSLFAVELFEKIKTERTLKSAKSFELKSNHWMGALALTALLIYHFSDEPMNWLNIGAIVMISLTGLLNGYQNRTLKYSIDKDGIRNLFNGKLVNTEKITSINFNPNELAVNTTKYQNELVIKSTNLVTPTWDELTSELKQLDKNGE